MMFENNLYAKPSTGNRLVAVLPLVFLAIGIVFVIAGLHGGGSLTHLGALACIALAAIVWRSSSGAKGNESGKGEGR